MKIWSEWYSATGAAKCKPIVEYILEKLSDPEEKLIIFAHHLAVISGIEEALSEKKFGHATVKIIGATPAMERTDNVERFQNQEKFIYEKNVSMDHWLQKDHKYY